MEQIDIAMTEPETVTPRRLSPRVRFELIFASVCLAFGLFVVPAAIYGVGTLLLGPYVAGLGTFYMNFFGDLATPMGRAWLIAVGPLALVLILRLLLRRRPRSEPADTAVQQEAPAQPAERARFEPSVGPD